MNQITDNKPISGDRQRSGWRWMLLSFVGTLLCILTGCGTTNTYTVTEQLLLSDAVDKAVAEINFSDLENRTVFLDSSKVTPSKQLGIVNTDYLIGSLRQQLIAAGCLLQEDKNQADVILEPRVGALGTESQIVTFGIPKSQELSTAASIFANAPIVPTVPEIAFGKNTLQYGAAKISLFAYERETKEPIWQSGSRVAKSNAKSTWLLGAGPFERGSIYNGAKFAGVKLRIPGIGPKKKDFSPPPDIPYANEVHFIPKVVQNETQLVQQAVGEEAAAETAQAPGDSEPPK